MVQLIVIKEVLPGFPWEGERIVWSAKEGSTMHDTALDQDLLGLQSPWTVSRVNLDVKGQRVNGWPSPGGRGVGVPSRPQDTAAGRSRRGADVAASRPRPVPDLPVRAYSTGGL